MKFIKKYKSFLEDSNASINASTSGMGTVISAQPGALPGQTGTTGSGDVSFTFKKEKRKKGGPSQVSDLRDLKDDKTNKVEDIKESYKLTEDESLLIEDCIVELLDMGFEINDINSYSEDQEYDIDDNTQGNFKSQKIHICLLKKVERIYRGNLTYRQSFNKSEFYDKTISTLRSGEKLDKYESDIIEVVDDASYKLINHLDYTDGNIVINFMDRFYNQMYSATFLPDKKFVNIEIHIILNRNFYPVDEAYNNEQEYINDIIERFKVYNIRPVILNKILDFYKDQIIDDYNNDKQPSEFVDMIVKDMELGSSGYMSQMVGSKGWNNKVIKYL
jgi:hypothetical protein